MNPHDFTLFILSPLILLPRYQQLAGSPCRRQNQTVKAVSSQSFPSKICGFSSEWSSTQPAWLPHQFCSSHVHTLMRVLNRIGSRQAQSRQPGWVGDQTKTSPYLGNCKTQGGKQDKNTTYDTEHLKEQKGWVKKQNREGRAETSAGDQHFTFGRLGSIVNIGELGVPPSRGRGRRGHGGQRDQGHEPEGWRAEGTGEGTEPRSQGWHSGEKESVWTEAHAGHTLQQRPPAVLLWTDWGWQQGEREGWTNWLLQ